MFVRRDLDQNWYLVHDAFILSASLSRVLLTFIIKLVILYTIFGIWNHTDWVKTYELKMVDGRHHSHWNTWSRHRTECTSYGPIHKNIEQGTRQLSAKPLKSKKSSRQLYTIQETHMFLRFVSYCIELIYKSLLFALIIPGKNYHWPHGTIIKILSELRLFIEKIRE